MGTEITLDVADAAITYAKNHRGMDHGSIFQAHDRKAVRSDQLNYEWYEENNEDPASAELAFTRPLRSIVPRLELLGFNMQRVEREYEAVTQNWLEERYFDASDQGPAREAMSFREYAAFVAAHPLDELDSTFVTPTVHRTAATVQARFDGEQVQRIPSDASHGTPSFSERGFFVSQVNILHPYSVLRLLAEVGANKAVPVTWQYGPLVDSGYSTHREFEPEARRAETFLIATEGSSDVHILKHALALLRPEIADFFRFVDVSESHPFSGAGSLVKFAEGLAKIDVHNQVLFVFDNDAEGLDAHRRLSKLSLPVNMRGVMLPELEEFRSFPAEGPEGLHRTDINRRAAAIECYLDLRIGGYPPAKVHWTNYKKDIDSYQGALEFKETYTKVFLKQTTQTLTEGLYDFHKIQVVLDSLVAECIQIATGKWEADGRYAH